MLPSIRNKNFICGQMTQKDIKKAFNFQGKAMDFVYDVLIEDGYVERHERYFKPTPKLINLAFGVDSFELNERALRVIASSEWFYRSEITDLFNGDKYIAEQAINEGYFLQIRGKYRRSEKLSEYIASGENILLFKKTS